MVKELTVAAALLIFAAGCISRPDGNVAELKLRAAANDPAALEQLGEIAMFYGVNGKIDYVTALDCFSRAADRGAAVAMAFKGRLLAEYPLPDGNFYEEGMALAAAAEPELVKLSGDPRADYLLGNFDAAEKAFYYPAAVEAAADTGLADRQRLLKLRRAAEWGCAAADYEIWKLLKQSDPAKAREHLNAAVKKEYPAALFASGNTDNIRLAAEKGYAPARVTTAGDTTNSLTDAERRKHFALAVTSAGYGAREYAAYLAGQGDFGHAALLDVSTAPWLYYPVAAIGQLSWRDLAFPSDFQRSAWLGTNDADALANFFEENRQYQNTAAYWLAYALSAAAADQGECELYGARRYAELGGDKTAAALIEADAESLLNQNRTAAPPVIADRNLYALAEHFLPRLFPNHPPANPRRFYNVVLGKFVEKERIVSDGINVVAPPPEPLVLE